MEKASKLTLQGTVYGKKTEVLLPQLCKLHAFAVKTAATLKSRCLLGLMKMGLAIKLKQKRVGSLICFPSSQFGMKNEALEIKIIIPFYSQMMPSPKPIRGGSVGIWASGKSS